MILPPNLTTSEIRINMKTRLQIASLIIFSLLLGSCGPTASTPLPTNGTTEKTSATETVGVSAPAEEETSPEVTFYPVSESDATPPQYNLFISPDAEGNPVPVTVECGDITAPVYAPSNGVILHNHCVLNTGLTTAHAVLPDGSIVSMGPDTTLQINLSEDSSDIVLEKGEIYTQVAPQGTSRRYAILAGDSSIEVKGTRYSVSLKDRLINVYVHEGQVFTHRCLEWRNYTCMKWYQLSSVPMEAGMVYKGSAGGDDWSSEVVEDIYNLEASAKQGVPMLLEFSYSGILVYAYNATGDINPANLENALDFAETKAIDALWPLLKDPNEYNQMAQQMNKSASAFYAAYPGNFPVTLEIEPVAPVEQPEMSEASPSGKFPVFLRDTCYTNEGHLWCYPDPSSVDPAMGAEWDITEICRAYPGEIPCSWPELKKTLP